MTEVVFYRTVLVNVLFLLANLGILWINVKLYTEVLKDRNSELRRRKGQSP